MYLDLLGKSLFCCSDFGNTFALTVSQEYDYYYNDYDADADADDDEGKLFITEPLCDFIILFYSCRRQSQSFLFFIEFRSTHY